MDREVFPVDTSRLMQTDLLQSTHHFIYYTENVYFDNKSKATQTN
jgi:hypothetical protein